MSYTVVLQSSTDDSSPSEQLSKSYCDNTYVCCGKELRIKRIALFVGVIISLFVPIILFSIKIGLIIEGVASGITFDIVVFSLIIYIYSINQSMTTLPEITYCKAAMINAYRFYVPLVCVIISVGSSIPWYFFSGLSPGTMMLIVYGVEIIFLVVYCRCS